jgi:5,10-methylenetetrahydromethanopterin reductase
MAVGAETSRISAALDTVRQARAEAGLTMDGFTVGAYVSVVPHHDRAVARRMASGNVASFARFSAMHGPVTGAGAGADSRMYERLHAAYTMRGHMRDGSPQSAQLTDEFIDRFAIVGPARHCIARLTELAGLGVNRFVISPPGFGADDGQAVRDRIAAEVLPGVREATAATAVRS